MGDDGHGHFKCVVRDEAAAAANGGSSSWTECAPDELALLPEPSALALKFSLFYPYALVPEAGEDGPVCNY